MHKLDEKGSLLIPLVITGTLLLASFAFGLWAFMGRQDYKDNVDSKISEAVAASNEILSLEKEADFAEREKSPFKSYQSPSTLGSVNISYPKVWSAYINESKTGSFELDGYIHPNFVPNTIGDTAFALRIQVVDQPLQQVLKTFEGNVKIGKVTATAYKAPKVQEESGLGSMITGELAPKKQGVMVLLPTRDKTIKIWTEGQDYRGDFKTMLESLTYVP